MSHGLSSTVCDAEPRLILALTRGGASNPVIIAVSATGAAAVSLGACATKTIHRVDDEGVKRRAIDRCVDAGGTPVGSVENILTCQIED